MKLRSWLKKINRKLKSHEGFSFAELLFATLIMLFATSILTSTISLAMSNYKKTVQASNAQLLCSTLSVYVENELSYAVVNKEIKYKDNSSSKAVLFSSEAHNFGPDAYFVIVNGNATYDVTTDSENVGKIAETSPIYTSTKPYYIAGKGAYGNDLFAGMTLKYDGKTFEAHIWVQNDDQIDGHKLAENYLRIIPLEIKE
jgi:hypothetical protein